jgi:hypothetical protein
VIGPRFPSNNIVIVGNVNESPRANTILQRGRLATDTSVVCLDLLSVRLAYGVRLRWVLLIAAKQKGTYLDTSDLARWNQLRYKPGAKVFSSRDVIDWAGFS